MLRHKLTLKTHQCHQFKASADAMSEQCRLAVLKLENIVPLVRSLRSTTGQLRNTVSRSSANNVENEVHIKLSQTLDRLVEILDGCDGRVQLSGRSQQQVPSASVPQSVSKLHWQSRNQVPPLSTSQIKERVAGPITSPALPKQSVRPTIAPSPLTLGTSS